jgi:hypothetical protein
VATWAPSAASWAVAVAAGSGLGRVLDGALPTQAQPPQDPGPILEASGLFAARAVAADPRPTFLRVFASARGHTIGAHEVVLERRRPGRGGAAASSWTAVALDRQGKELGRHPIHLVHPQRPGYLEALVPASAEVAGLELRSGRRLASLRVERPDGDLSLADVRLSPGPRPELSWRADHSTGLDPRITLAVRASQVVTPVAALDTCGGRDLIWLDRLGPIDRLVLQASDGWTSLDIDVDADVPEHERLALRRLADGRWFAEAPTGWELTWTLEGRRLDQGGALVEVPAGARGLLAVEARGPEGERRIDARRVDEEIG